MVERVGSGTERVPKDLGFFGGFKLEFEFESDSESFREGSLGGMTVRIPTPGESCPCIQEKVLRTY